ncbi:hypothetical protein NIIDNTM18_38960 [Mycolicibacterium litorale]|uniref:PE-PGRS family protein n=2 Tax=Mycolicibacterium litorale TaxID=758802 RepID=A0A6S6PEW6_9MYCO|nr:hypothetical protein NIIDNTM18_38960 [Mycolicibacterium litorale]
MHIAARSYLSTGVALVGAGAIAVSPVAPPVPDVEVPTLSTIGVELNAAVNPLQTWIEVFGTAAQNLSVLGQQIAERPAPILQQIIENQLSNIETLAPAVQSFVTGFVNSLDPFNPDGIPANLREAVELIVTGNPAEGFPAIFQAFLQPILFPSLELLVPVQGIITQTAQNILDVANQAIAVVAIGAIGLLNPVFSGFSAVGAATQAVVDAADEGDVAGVITAVLDIPGVVAGGIINGFGFDGGILTPMSGTIAALLTLRNTIADALKPNPPAAGLTAEASSIPEDAGTTVTFDITDGEASLSAASSRSAAPENAAPGAGGDGGLAVVEETTEDEATGGEAAEENATEEEATEQVTDDEVTDDVTEEATEQVTDEVTDDEAADEEAADAADDADSDAAEQEPAAGDDDGDGDATGAGDSADNGTGGDDTGGADA